MATNYDSLITALENAIKTNGTGAITGAVAQAAFLNVVESLTVGFQFMGVATPSTSPDSNDKKEFYIGESGSYANFGSSLTVPDGSIVIFIKDNGSWTSKVIKVNDSISFAPNNISGGFNLQIGSNSVKIFDLLNKSNSIAIEAETDLDDITTCGVYSFTSAISETLANVPQIGGAYMLVERTTPSNEERYKQSLIFGLGKTYSRTYTGVALGWTSWCSVEINSEIVQSLRNAIVSTGIVPVLEERNGWIIKPDGELYSGEGSGGGFIKKYDVSGLDSVLITGRQGNPTTDYALAAFYDSKDGFVSSVVGTAGTNYEYYEVTVPSSAKYVIVCSSNIASQPVVDCNSRPVFDLLSKGGAYTIQNNTDLNIITDSGVYGFTASVAQTLKNIPQIGGGFLIVENTTPSSSTPVKQTIIFGLGHTYTRYLMGATLGWSEWISVERNKEAIEYFSQELVACGFYDGFLTPAGAIDVASIVGGNPIVLKFNVVGLSNIFITGRQGNNVEVYALYAFYDNNGDYISSSAFVGVPGTDYIDYEVSVPSEAAYICICSSNTSYLPKVQCKKAPFELIIPVYWKQYLDNKIETINNNRHSIGGKGDGFVFITDIHEDYNYGVSPSLIEYILKKTPIKNIVIGGDLYTNASDKTQALAYLQGLRNKYDYTERLFAIRGNHDSGNSITEGEYYSVFDSPLENVIETLEAGVSYYYRDNKAQKIRYIFCDCPNYQAAMPTEQITWLQNKITELQAGWTVVIFAHAYWNVISGGSVAITAYGSSLASAIDSVIDDSAATVAALIVGHTHADRDATSEKGYKIISTTCDAGGAMASNYDPITPNRVKGTTSEQSFDVYNIDTLNKKIYITKIGGNGTDREFTYE